MNTLITIILIFSLLWIWWIINKQDETIKKQKICIDLLTYEINDMRKKLSGAPICRFNGMPESRDLKYGKCWLTLPNIEGWVFDYPDKCPNWSHWAPHWFIPLVTAPKEPQP